MILSMDDLRDFIRNEIKTVMSQKRKDEANPHHGMRGSPSGGEFVSKEDDGSWAIGDKQYKYRSGKRGSSTAPCGRKDPTRKRTCSMGVIKDSDERG